MNPRLARISIFPVKSLDSNEPQKVEITPAGPIEGDRRYAIVDEDGEYVNGKRTQEIHRIRAEYNSGHVTLSEHGGDERHEFALENNREELVDWLTDYFGYPVELVHDEAGLPDDTTNTGPTVISTATIEAVASWFDLSTESVRRRFRANLEIEGVPAFWEDNLFTDHSRVVEFSIGNVTLAGVNPCQRCVVPSRNPDTGEELEGFRQRFIEKRQETLPEWTDSGRFDHPFRLMVNTRVENGGEISVGDPVEILGERAEQSERN